MTTTLNFLKMEGLGNDFLVTHELEQSRIAQMASKVAQLCHRRTGVGGDGIIFILPSSHADFTMRIFNSDGSEAEMCGNGIRCCALYAKKMKLSTKQHLTFETKAGIIETAMLDSGLITVNMGKPILDAAAIPTIQPSGRVIMHDLMVNGKLFKITALSIGNPHAVIFTDQITDEQVQFWGKQIETSDFFPKKTNVEFVKVLSEKEIQMRVWERGCGETEACGTGTCASVVAGIINKLHGNSVTVHLRGGDLFVEWDGKETSPVFMTGPAKVVFGGSVG